MRRRPALALALIATAAGCSSTTNASDAGSADAVTSQDASMLADAGTDAADSSTAIDTGSCPSTLASIGSACRLPADCPAGFFCQSASGVVLQQSCQIRCDDPTVACPCGTHCVVHNDKTGMPWHQCDI